MTSDEKWYLAQYHTNHKTIRLIDKAWFSGYAFVGAILPDSRFDIRLGSKNGSVDIWIESDQKTYDYITNNLLSDVDKWSNKALDWSANEGRNSLLPHEDYCQKNWMSHSIMFLDSYQWFIDNGIKIES